MFPPLCKIRSRHPRELKLTGLIAYVMLYKMCEFESSIITNDVITKQWQNSDLRETKQSMHHSSIDESYPKIYFLLNSNTYVKSYGHFCQMLAFFTMPAHKIWSCHVTQKAHFEKFLFCPNSTFNIGKNHKVSSGKALYFRRYQAKTSWGGNTPRQGKPFGANSAEI